MSKTEMEILFDKFIDIFHKYSQMSPDNKGTLNRYEFKKFVEEQFPHYLKHTRDPKAVRKLFSDLDRDKNNSITFMECMGLVAKILMFTHEDYFQHEGGGPMPMPTMSLHTEKAGCQAAQGMVPMK